MQSTLACEKLLAASDISVCGALPNRRLFGAGGVGHCEWEAKPHSAGDANAPHPI